MTDPAVQDCCGFTRRDLVRLAAAGAGAGLVLPGLLPAPAAAAAGQGVFPQDLELVTVTDTGFVLTWYTAAGPTPAIPYQPGQEPAPVACDGVVRYGTRPDRLDRVAVQRHGDSAYHQVEVEGLRPGTTYYYQALSARVPATARMLPQLTFPAGGLVIPPDPTNGQLLAILAQLLSSGIVHSAAPGQVTTLVPPRGRHLFSLALANDLHVGETVSGLATASFPPGFSQVPGLRRIRR
ncbi:fibronectin type III domain-containing protein [Catenulispora sp. EB89]|uniref:fibronectin type III domain-containing protein n=1 Tax=Catenulispora sp. EB89 TaxID=3156257 RepID=UPI003517FA65